MNLIDTFNLSVSNAINKRGDFYEVLIGKEEFTPETTIVDSGDFNCGAVMNELEFCRAVSQYYVESFDIDGTDGVNLELLINALIDMPKRPGEEEATFRKRFLFISIQKNTVRWTTRGSILQAISYFVSDMSKVQLVEFFDSIPTYFQIRFEGTVLTEGALFLNQGFLDNEFLGGAGIGEVVSYIGELVDRIKAAGVDYDILFIDQYQETLACAAIIGSVQKYLTVDARIKGHVSISVACDATVV